MSDLRLVIYKDQHSPRSISLSTRTLYRTLVLGSFASLFFIGATILLIKLYLRGPTKISVPSHDDQSDSIIGPTNSPEELIRALRDEIELSKSRLQNAQALQNAPKELDSKNPALGLFSPIVTDKTQSGPFVKIANFKYSPGDGKSPLTLTFELHNAGSAEIVQKGYIVVLARNDSSLLGYPNIFRNSGPYLIDFEKGETFQVARFRLVNAQFSAERAKNFQILIFSRSGELLINTMHEVSN
ncbi:MAG TPA: hypothetical protein PLH57_10730 [Oligoflexia bacterium]|nr:hypothetical protein [Oligoflexia bacterium]